MCIRDRYWHGKRPTGTTVDVSTQPAARRRLDWSRRRRVPAASTTYEQVIYSVECCDKCCTHNVPRNSAKYPPRSWSVALGLCPSENVAAQVLFQSVNQLINQSINQCVYFMLKPSKTKQRHRLHCTYRHKQAT